MTPPTFARGKDDPLPRAQAEAVWRVLELVAEDGPDGPDDVRGFVSRHTMPTGVVVIDHWPEDRRWLVYPGGYVTWMPIPFAVHRAVTA